MAILPGAGYIGMNNIQVEGDKVKKKLYREQQKPLAFSFRISSPLSLHNENNCSFSSELKMHDSSLTAGTSPSQCCSERGKELSIGKYVCMH